MAKDLTAALAALTEGDAGSRKDARLPSATPLPTIPARTGTAGPTTSSVGGGIASPLTETAYADRVWHTERTVTSSDGLFSMRIRPVDTIKFSDANLAVVEMKYKAPA